MQTDANAHSSHQLTCILEICAWSSPNAQYWTDIRGESRLSCSGDHLIRRWSVWAAPEALSEEALAADGAQSPCCWWIPLEGAQSPPSYQTSMLKSRTAMGSRVRVNQEIYFKIKTCFRQAKPKQQNVLSASVNACSRYRLYSYRYHN